MESKTKTSLPWNGVSNISHWWAQTFPSTWEWTVALSRGSTLAWCGLRCCLMLPRETTVPVLRAKRNSLKRTWCHLVALNDSSAFLSFSAVEKRETCGWVLVFYPRKFFWEKVGYPPDTFCYGHLVLKVWLCCHGSFWISLVPSTQDWSLLKIRVKKFWSPWMRRNVIVWFEINGFILGFE